MRYFLLTSILLISLALAVAVSAQDRTWSVSHSIEIEATKELLLLSPDGRKIFEADLWEPDEMCVRDITTLEVLCETVTGGRISQNSVSWAPDSSAVVFSTEWVNSGIDSDIRVFHADTGTVENLTEDRIEAYRNISESFPIDVYPSWTQDSQALIFQRLHYAGGRHEILRIPRDGGEPEPYTALPDEVAPILNAPIHVLNDGSLLFSTSPGPDDALSDGVFRMTLDGAVDLIVPGPGAPGPPTILGDVSPDGSSMVVARIHLVTTDPGAPFFFLVDTAQGTMLPIEGEQVASPVFLPDGSGILTATQSDHRSIALSVLTSDGSSADLHTIPAEENPEPGLAAVPVAQSLTWTDSGVILAHTHTRAVLLSVEPGGGAVSPVSDPATPLPEGSPSPAGETPASPTPESADQGDAPYRALRPTEMEPGAEIARLSPDGGQVAIMRSGGTTELCARELASDDEVCAEIPFTSVNLQTISWSPNSSALVFTDEPIITGNDTDIWLFDTVSGDVSNMTDDGTDLLAESGAPMDVHPGWSLDGETIIFQRYHADGVSLMRIPRAGGEPEEIVAFPEQYATIMSSPAFPLKDGSIILGTMPATGFTTGIFRIAPDGTFEHLADESLIPSHDSLVVVDVTEDGSKAIVYGRAGFEIRFHRGELWLLDLTTGELSQPEPLVGVPASPATFSPDDKTMLSAMSGDGNLLSLALTDLETGDTFDLAVIDSPEHDDQAEYPLISLVWATNDTVLLHTGTPTSVLIELVPATP